MAPERVSVARITGESEQTPRLELLESVPCEGEAQQAPVLQDLVKKHNLAYAPCAVVLDPGDYSLLQVESPEVEAAELKSAIRWRVKDLIDFHIDDAVIDLFDIPGQNQPGRPKMMYVVAAHAPLIQKQVDLIEASGLTLTSIDVTELVLRNIAKLLPEDEGGGALLYVAQTHGLIILTQQSNLYLARGMGVNMSRLLTVEDAWNGNTGAPVDSAGVLESLVLEIQRSLDYYESYFSQPPIKGLVLNPTVPEVLGFIHYTHEHLGIPVRALDLNTMLETEEPLNLTQQAEGLLAVGAALRGREANNAAG